MVPRRPLPIVQAPMAAGPSCPELVAAVSGAGGLGFLAAGYKTPDAVLEEIRATRALTAEPFGVNVFVPGLAADPADYAAFVERMRIEAAHHDVGPGEACHDDDGWEGKLEILEAERVAVASFAFGCPPADAIRRLQAVGTSVWVTVTDVGEAEQAAAAGSDAVVAQGIEAGAHRGSFIDDESAGDFGLLALLQRLRAATDLPLVATGGIATGAAVAAVLCAGAEAAQLGTAFLRCPEAGTSQVHRDALAVPGRTALTRAFTGRTARAIVNRFLSAHGPHAPAAYPEIHYLTAPLRAAARAAGDADAVNLWAGQTYELARELPAAELVRALAAEASEALAAATARLR